jgi:hypothetical protein
VQVSLDHALACGAPGLLRSFGDALLAQDGEGLVELAIGLLERVLAIQHARARHLTELLDELHRNLGH